MFRQALPATVLVALLITASGCGDADEASPLAPTDSPPALSPTDSPSSTVSPPPPAYEQTPGQAGRVRTALTTAGFACTDLADQYVALTACSKEAGRLDFSWFKFAADKDGTVLTARASSFQNVKPAVTAIVGPADTAILLARGTTLQWGYAGPDWLSIKGMNSAPQPPAAEPFETTRADLLRLYQNDKTLTCEIEDSTPTPSPSQPGAVVPSVSPTPAPSTLLCQPDSIRGGDRSTITATFAGPQLTDLELRGEYDFKGENRDFSILRASVKRYLDKLWPALKGADAAEIRTYVDQRLQPGKGGIAYIGTHKVVVRTLSMSGYPPKITVRIGTEKTGLEELGF